jgi:hypothetical protein
MGLRNSWRFFVAILVPLVLIPLPLKSDDIIVEEDGSSRPATVRQFESFSDIKATKRCPSADKPKLP